jgi:Transposase DDE domain
MYHTPTVLHRTTSWFHGEIEACLRRCFEHLLAQGASEPHEGRPPEVPDLSLWMALIIGLLRGVRSQRAIWRLLISGGLWHEPCYDVSDQAIYNRLDRQGSGPLPALFATLTELLLLWLHPSVQAQADLLGELAPFAREVVALDESTLDAVARRLPCLRNVPAGDERLLPGKLVALFDIRQQVWRAIRFVPNVREMERQHAREMLSFIAKGALILTDLGYFGFEWFDELTKQGYSWVTRFREQTTFVVVHTYFEEGETFDKLVWMGIWKTQGAFVVRMVQFQQGGQLRQYLSNVLDPRNLSMQQIAEVYARRWDIERAFLTLKKYLGVHLLFSSKPQVVLAQVWACLILSQVVQAIRVQIASLAGVEVFDVSLPLLMDFLSQWNQQGEEGWRQCVEQGWRLGIIRPSSRLKVQAPQIPLQAYRPVPVGRTLVRPARYPGTQSGVPEADEESKQVLEVIRQRAREVRASKKQSQKQQAKEEAEQIKAQVSKAIKAKKEEVRRIKEERAKEGKAKEEHRREERRKEEQVKWCTYWEQKPPPGAEAPPWSFYLPWLGKGEEERVS